MNNVMLHNHLGVILGIDARRNLTSNRAVGKHLPIAGGMAWILVSRG